MPKAIPKLLQSLVLVVMLLVSPLCASAASPSTWLCDGDPLTLTPIAGAVDSSYLHVFFFNLVSSAAIASKRKFKTAVVYLTPTITRWLNGEFRAWLFRVHDDGTTAVGTTTFAPTTTATNSWPFQHLRTCTYCLFCDNASTHALLDTFLGALRLGSSHR